MAEPADAFLKTVLRSRLLERSQLQEAVRDMPAEARGDPQTLADQLVNQGKLSPFQAHKLLQGAYLGLALDAYHIQTPIGRGGMGTVYLARDTRDGQYVAVKVLPPRLANEKGHYLARFQREMELSKKVVHPSIAHTHEVGVHKGVYYIAMEYIPGLSLHRLVTQQGPLLLPRTAKLFAEVAAALEHAHGMNLIHRDLKPSNIMITPNDQAKLLDLGLAVFEGENGQPLEVIGGRGYMVGSLDFMAPEQTEDSLAVDARTDLYSLGCSLYFALSGKTPFPEGGRKEKVQAHRYLDARPLREHNAAIPQKFAELVEKLMAKNPDRRYPTAQAVRQELLAWCGAEAATPTDRKDDSMIRESVRALEAAPLPRDSLGEEPILPLEQEPSGPESDFDEVRAVQREWWWLLGCVAGFWIVLLIGMLIARLVQ